MLKWSEEFATGSPLVDTQHKILIEKINHLEEVIVHPLIARADADALMNFLGSYASSHFQFEEQCMHRYNCPAHETNKRAHEQFVEVMSKLSVRYSQEGPRPDLLKSVHHFTQTWIKEHILTIDTQLRQSIPH